MLMSMNLGRKAAWVACVVLGLGAAANADTIVYSNNAGGDAFNVNDGPTAADRGGQAVSGSNWYYNSVGGDATIGISSAESWSPRSGNGSVLFHGVDGSSKADIEYFNSAGQITPGGVFVPISSMGLLKDLSAFSYDWYRDGSSTNPAVQTPSLRLQITDGQHSGYLVFEQVYNGAVVANQWNHSDVLGSQLTLWSNGSLPDQNQYNHDLDYWINTAGLGNYSVLSISSGIGSGWNGAFTGGVDNITFGFNGANTTYNFEVAGAVPEPASVVSFLIAGGLGLAGAAARRRRAR